MAPPIVALVATRDRPLDLERTLTSLARCERPPSFKGVVVVDNGRQDDGRVAAIVRRTADGMDATTMRWPAGGKSAALNHALTSLGAGDLVFFTDDDVRVGPGTLVAYANAAGERARGAMYGGDVEVEYEAEPPTWLKRFLPLSVLGFHPGARSELFLGANWAAFASDLRAVGGFDDALGPGSTSGATGQETAAQQALTASGVSAVSVPGAVVVHRVHAAQCTPEWALARTRREGIHHAWLDVRAGRALRVVARVPATRDFLAHLGASWLRELAADLRKDDVAKFAARFERAYLDGYAFGVRFAHRARSTT